MILRIFMKEVIISRKKSMNTLVKQKESLLDLIILIPILVLSSISILYVFSASNVTAYENFSNSFFYVERQMVALAIALILFFAFLFVPISFYRKYGLLLFFLSSVLLLIVLFPGIGKMVNGSRRWLDFGFINIQPSEIAKVFVPLYLCSYCLRRKEQLESSWRGFLKPILITSIISILLFFEPDIGAMVVIFAIGISILFIGGAKLSQLGILSLIFFLLVSIFVYFNAERLDRVLEFSNPWDNQQGSDYQLINALIASIQGGFFGLGIGESTQKYYFLPEAHTDFIFSIYIEETGLLGLLLLLSSYLIILGRLYYLAERSMKKNFYFNSLIITAFAVTFFFQTALNVFVNLGLIPTKGLALPFISYGRSSVIMNFIALAIMLRASWEFRNNLR
tara:strand:- start:859 stop:2040 length:1182 start_codon:yes stop_codon:yes gene_type:complete